MKYLKSIVILFVVILIALFLSNYINVNVNVENYDNTRPVLFENIDSIYYINLEHRDDRKAQFLDNFNSENENKIHRVNAHYYKNNGAVGCLMSHITALNLALNNKSSGENVLICEDDLEIKDMEYCNKMLKLLFENIKDWDVIMLGQNTSESSDTNIKTHSGEKIIKILDSQTCSGYLIKKSYIPKLLEIYENNMNMFLKTNVWGEYYTDQSWKKLQKTDNWYSFSPSVAVQRPSYSDIVNQNVNYGV
jgi:GR25 family glycosyltransferase involved in LPS biosynthesis